MFIRINTSDAKRGYDTDYEVSKIQIFISEFKDKKIKENENTIKELEEEIEKLKLWLCMSYKNVLSDYKVICVVCWPNKLNFLKQKQNNNKKIIQRFTDWCYKNKMKAYCVMCRKNTENVDTKMVRTKNGRLLMQSKCTFGGIKKSRFVKEQKAKGFLSNLGIKIPLSKVPLSNVLF